MVLVFGAANCDEAINRFNYYAIHYTEIDVHCVQQIKKKNGTLLLSDNGDVNQADMTDELLVAVSELFKPNCARLEVLQL